MQIEKLVWQVLPTGIPCFACHKREAENRVTIRLSPASTLTACMCQECSQLTETELVAHLEARK